MAVKIKDFFSVYMTLRHENDSFADYSCVLMGMAAAKEQINKATADANNFFQELKDLGAGGAEVIIKNSNLTADHLKNEFKRNKENENVTKYSQVKKTGQKRFKKMFLKTKKNH